MNRVWKDVDPGGSTAGRVFDPVEPELGGAPGTLRVRGSWGCYIAGQQKQLRVGARLGRRSADEQ